MDEIELTEMIDIEVIRQDAVKSPASGFPVLVMKAKASSEDCPGCGCCPDCTMEPAAKAVNSRGGIDEKPDIDGAHSVLQGLARLIQNEAAEMAVGAFDEVCDIQMLCEAASLMRWFCEREQMGDTDDGAMLKEAGAVFKAHRKFSSDDRKQLASEGNALPDGSYPIPDEDALRRAAILARSGHGDVAAAKRLIAKRARELGVPNPLADHDKTEKDAPESVTPETSEPADGQVSDGDGVAKSDDIDSKIEQAVAKATQATEGRVEALKAELAELRNTPIPGGPMLAATSAVADDKRVSELMAKEAYHADLAIKTSGELSKYHKDQAKAAKAAQAEALR